MKTFSLVWLALLGWLMTLAVRADPAAVYAYPLPAIYSSSTNYALTINGTNVPVINYTPEYDYAECSLSNGTATVQVTALGQTGITSLRLSPQKLGLTPTTNGNTITFTLSASTYLIIALDGRKPCMLAVDPPETNAPPSSGPGIFNVLSSPYFGDNTGRILTTSAIQGAINDASTYGKTNASGPGIVFVPAGTYLCSNLVFKSSLALYLQGGAVIRCTGNPANYSNGGYRGSLDGIVPAGTRFLLASNVANITLYGRGTVDGNGIFMGLSNNFGDNLMILLNCTNFTADGVTFRDAGGWGVVPTQSTNVAFSNLKIFDNVLASQDDGIDIVDTRTVTVSNVLAIAGDDALSTKSYYYPISQVLFEDGLLWTHAIACKIGWSVATPQTGITFSNLVVYDCMNAVGLTEYDGSNGVGNVAANLTWDTIDVETNTLGGVGRPCWAIFSIKATNGLATNVLVRNITVRDSGLNGVIGGMVTNTLINGITFDSIYMPGGNGTPASNLFQMDLFDFGAYSNLTILPASSSLPAIYLTTNDAIGTTSFNAPGHWSNGQAPVAGTNYVVAGYTLRTPGSGNATFTNSTLTLYDGASLSLKNDNNTTMVGSSPGTGLILDDSSVRNVDTANDTFAGYVTLLADGGVFEMPGGSTHTFTIAATVGGAGFLQAGSSGDAGTIVLTSSNSFSGGVVFGTGFTNSLILRVSGAGTFGAVTGPVTLNSNTDVVDLNGTSQGIGDLTGPAGILTNSAAQPATLMVGNGDNGGGVFGGNLVGGSGPLSLIKTGNGTITLAGTNTYTGSTTINAGVLALNGGGLLAGTPTITLAPGATLDASARTDQTLTLNSGQTLNGGGFVAGNLTVAGGAGVAPGSSGTNATLTVQGNLQLSGSLVLKLNDTNTPSCDQLLTASGTITAGGALTVTNLGPALQAGDTFPLVNHLTGSFTALTLPALSPGLAWTNRLALDGTLQVVSTIATNPPTLTTTFTASNLTLNWPADHTGWRLQVTTNFASPTWQDVTNATSTNQWILPINPATPAVYYRLIFP